MGSKNHQLVEFAQFRALRHWAPLIGLIGSIELGQFTGGFAGCEVDGLEDVLEKTLR